MYLLLRNKRLPNAGDDFGDGNDCGDGAGDGAGYGLIRTPKTRRGCGYGDGDMFGNAEGGGTGRGRRVNKKAASPRQLILMAGARYVSTSEG